MDTFFAISEPRRRQIIELIAEHGEMSASEIGSKFRVTLPAISQHLKILREANIVQVEKKAQQRLYKINTVSLQELEEWTDTIKKKWHQRFDLIEKILNDEKILLASKTTKRL